MRTLLRTTLITALIALSVLIVLSLVHSAYSANSARAAAGLSVPSYCVPEGLAGVEEQLAKTKDASTTQRLLAKKQDALNAEATCVANATLYPPAAKPKNRVGVLLPTPVLVQVPTPTLQLGIQASILGVVPGMNFVPIADQNNLWEGREWQCDHN